MPTEILTRTTQLQRLYDTNNASASPSSVTAVTASVANIKMMQAFRGLQAISFFGTDAANETLNWILYASMQVQQQRVGDPGLSTPSVARDAVYLNRIVALGTATLGTATGIEGGVVADTDFFADTIVISSTSAFGTHLAAVSGQSIAVHSPEDNSIAQLVVPDLWNAYGWVLDVYRGTAATANAVVAMGT
jgi:hypothetical protein